MVKGAKAAMGTLALAAVETFGPDLEQKLDAIRDRVDEEEVCLHSIRHLKRRHSKTNHVTSHFRLPARIFSEENSDVIFYVGDDSIQERIPAHSWILASSSPVFRAMFRGPMAASNMLSSVSSGVTLEEAVSSQVTLINDDQSPSAAKDDDCQLQMDSELLDRCPPNPNDLEKRTIESCSSSNHQQPEQHHHHHHHSGSSSGRLSRQTVRVGDVDGRAFDILLRYLYNEQIQLKSVSTALMTLYAAHKYMCPGLVKQVVTYLAQNLCEKNVLVVLHNICNFCTGTAENSYDRAAGDIYWEVPVTKPPVKFPGNNWMSAEPSAPPSTAESSAHHDQAPLLKEEDDVDGDKVDLTEDEIRDYECGLAMPSSSSFGGSGTRGERVNCCNALLKQCLELIDSKASVVLGSEDVEDLELLALNMIVCRDTLRVKSENDVFDALLRWSSRECKRQKLEMTSDNRRKVLKGSQYLVRYLVMSPEEFTKGPYKSGLLTTDEEEALLAKVCGVSANFAHTLPDHLTHWLNIMNTKRRGTHLTYGLTLAKRRIGSGLKRKASTTKTNKNGKAVKDKNNSSSYEMSKDRKEKLNLIEEFFVCLACIFD